jgi:hypothetical protein
MGIRKEDLADGKVLRVLVAQFREKKTEETLTAALHCLRDSTVLVPGAIFMTDKGKNDKDAKMRFDVYFLTNIEGKFLPVFSDGDQIDAEHRDQFTTVEKEFMDVMDIVLTDKDVTGIVLDPFTHPLVVPADLFPVIKKMPSNLEK